ncbi:MAG: alanine--tRNA ligase [Oscillospiraceae bacterium]|nr:alanine--tRNA ligase [Oscillospiraceae bacterium]
MSHKYYGLNELREMFLKFFESKGHLRLPSFSLVPQNDPSLLLINSGMAPMKPWFTGEAEPPRRRVCTCQKCIRTGDIENIGKTSRHGTYFEMLGNFSFGDYFKHEAIAWCWEFLTSPEWVGLEPEKLYPSIYMDDDEAFDIWNKEIGIPAERITRLGKEDNFWEHGSGPCGPCSEVYYDRGEAYGCGKPDCAPGCDCDRYMEVWNNVFSQFNNDGENHYTDLAQKNIDTGMGLERLACVCQNVDSLFDVDTVMNITHRVSELTGAHYNESRKKDVSLRVITDHIRSAVFMTADGVLPSNEGRGYVLRRLLRRAARHGKLLGVNEPFLYEIIDTVVHENECHYPELREKQDYITRVVKTEEESFARTIDAGMRIFSDLLTAYNSRGEGIFSGTDAFKLYDTFGFPIDLTVEMAGEQGLDVDLDAFDSLMQEQRERARAARGDMSDAWKGIDLGLDTRPTEFTGYSALEDTGSILALVAVGEVTGVLSEGYEGIIVLDKTPFYAEMGGQSADHGEIISGSGVFAVDNVQKDKGGKVLHYGHVVSGEMKTGDSVTAKVDAERHHAIMRAHSATHLLQAALRQVLGDHVHQAGSLVEPDRLRFDFTHFSAMTPTEIVTVDHMVDDMVLDGMNVNIEEMPIAAAREKGAMALFGEKYGDIVRVVDMGGKSVELCGGTHVGNTAMIGPFCIVSEQSVASGVRRIEAVTGKAFIELSCEREMTLAKVAEKLKTSPTELLRKVDSFTHELHDLHATVERLTDKLRAGDMDGTMAAAHKVGDVRVLTAVRDGVAANEMRRMGDYLRDKDESIVAVLASTEGEKITFLAVCGKKAVAGGLKAGDIIREVCAMCGGKGGGKPDSAMGGGKGRLKLDDALARVDDLVAEKLGIGNN